MTVKPFGLFLNYTSGKYFPPPPFLPDSYQLWRHTFRIDIGSFRWIRTRLGFVVVTNTNGLSEFALTYCHRDRIPNWIEILSTSGVLVLVHYIARVFPKLDAWRHRRWLSFVLSPFCNWRTCCRVSGSTIYTKRWCKLSSLSDNFFITMLANKRKEMAQGSEPC